MKNLKYVPALMCVLPLFLERKHGGRTPTQGDPQRWGGGWEVLSCIAESEDDDGQKCAEWPPAVAAVTEMPVFVSRGDASVSRRGLSASSV